MDAGSCEHNTFNKTVEDANLAQKFLEYQYRTIKVWNESEEQFLVRDMLSGQIMIKEYRDVYQIPIFERLKTLRHRNIQNIIGVYEINGRGIVIEEFLDGRTLKSVMEIDGVMSEETAADYIVSLCDGLEVLHNCNIVHRDIQPENIIISKAGIPKITGFRHSRVRKGKKSRDTVLIGTPRYAAPEQYGITESDKRVDIYALGVMLNVMLTGRFPKDIIYDKNKVLKDVIIKCINVDKEQRFRDVAQLKNELGKNEKGYYIRKIIKEIPGFRDEKILPKICAAIGYPVMICYIYIFSTEIFKITDMSKMFVFFLIFIVDIFMVIFPFIFLTNFFNIEIKVFKLVHVPKGLRYLVRFILAYISMMIASAICMFLGAIFVKVC